MIIQKTREEIELMRQSALIVSKTLGMIASEIKPGVTTLHLDKLAEESSRTVEGSHLLGVCWSWIVQDSLHQVVVWRVTILVDCVAQVIN